MKRVLLGELLEEVADKTTVNNQYPVLTSSKSGLFLQSDYFNKQVASKNNVGYKIIKKGQFTYRAMSDTGEFFPNMLECTEIGIVSPAYPVFKNIKQNEVTNEFLKYYFKSGIFQNAVSRFAQGSTRTSVKFGKLKTITIELPRLEEQTQIVAKLKKLDHLIGLQQQQISLIEDVVKSRFVELFGDLADPKCRWTKEKIVDACKNPDDIKCGPFGTQLSKDEYCDSGVAVWEIPQINSGFTAQPTHFLTDEKANQLEAYSIKSGDIAMSRKGNVGRCAVFPDTMKDGIIHSDVLRIRVNNELVLPVFMMHQLHYSRAVQHQIELVSSGAIMAGINVTKLKQIEVHIPPMELQKQFTNFVAEVDKSKHFSELEVAA